MRSSGGHGSAAHPQARTREKVAARRAAKGQQTEKVAEGGTRGALKPSAPAAFTEPRASSLPSPPAAERLQHADRLLQQFALIVLKVDLVPFLTKFSANFFNRFHFSR